MMESAGRVAIVTGAGSGIGKASALALMRAGWHVVLAGRRASRLEAALVEAGGDQAGRGAAGAPAGRGLAVPTDVADEASVRALFEKAVATFGRVDLLFNNAGVGTPATPLEDLELAAWRGVVDINLTGAFLCTREAFRVMKAQSPRGGRIINNGSISAHAPRPDSIAYTATKHAITGLTRATSLDGRRHDIACGQIDIGNAGTELAAMMSKGVRQADGSIVPEPVMDVGHVADTIVYMASLPLDANVLFLTVMATKMPYVGRG